MSRRVLAWTLAATALSAALYGLAFPPLSWRPVAWVCLVPLLVALGRVGPAAAAGLSALWAVLASAFVADALPSAVSTYYLQPAWIGWLFAVFVWVVTGSVYYAVFGLAMPFLRALPRTARPLLVAAAWTALELARGRLWTGSTLFVGNPWALFGYSQADFLPAVQIASVTGIYGVSFVLVAANAGLAELALAWWQRETAPRAWRALTVGVLPALAALAFGVATLARAPEPAEAGGSPVLLVQGDVDLGSRWRPEFYGRNLDHYLELTARGLQEVPARLVIWPEGALTFFLEEEAGYRRTMAALLAAHEAELLVGGPRREGPEGAPRFFNSTFLVSPSGAIRDSYDKRHLVPFSEFFPVRGVELVRRRFERVRVFTHGTRNAPLPTVFGPAGILTCNEAMLPEVAAARVRDGARFLVNPSNDTWISEPAWAELMFDMVSMRAVEQRRALLRASTSGPSAVVDGWGRVRAKATLGRPGLVLAALVPREEPSAYARLGDLFGLGCALATLLAAAGGLRRSRTRPSRSSATSTA